MLEISNDDKSAKWWRYNSEEETCMSWRFLVWCSIGYLAIDKLTIFTENLQDEKNALSLNFRKNYFALCNIPLQELEMQKNRSRGLLLKFLKIKEKYSFWRKHTVSNGWVVDTILNLKLSGTSPEIFDKTITTIGTITRRYGTHVKYLKFKLIYKWPT